MKAFAAPKSTLIIANGERPELSLYNYYRHHADCTIALDGAAVWLKSIGERPDVIIGDFDSAPYQSDDGIHRHIIADQNSNDLEKAFAYCRDHKKNQVIVLGAFGLRADHFLTNLYVMRKFAPTLSITFVDHKHYAFMCPCDRPLTFEQLCGAFVSLYPCGDTVGPIWSTGVAYPLAGEILSAQTRIGTLNRITDEHARVSCSAGDLLIIVEARSLCA